MPKIRRGGGGLVAGGDRLTASRVGKNVDSTLKTVNGEKRSNRATQPRLLAAGEAVSGGEEAEGEAELDTQGKARQMVTSLG